MEENDESLVILGWPILEESCVVIYVHLGAITFRWWDMALRLNVHNWDDRKFWVIKEEPFNLDRTPFHPFYKGSSHLHIDSLVAIPWRP